MMGMEGDDNRTGRPNTIKVCLESSDDGSHLLSLQTISNSLAAAAASTCKSSKYAPIIMQPARIPSALSEARS